MIENKLNNKMTFEINTDDKGHYVIVFESEQMLAQYINEKEFSENYYPMIMLKLIDQIKDVEKQCKADNQKFKILTKNIKSAEIKKIDNNRAIIKITVVGACNE